MAQIYDHRPKTRGAGPAPTEFHGAMEGLAAAGRDRELMKEAKRREDLFQRGKERWDTEQDIMGMRLEEAQRQRAEGLAARNAQQAALDAAIEDPQGKWHNIVENRLGPQQWAALQRMRADPNTPPGAIESWLDSVGDQYRMQDTMKALQTFSDRAQRILAHTAGDSGSSPIEQQVGELIQSVKDDPSQENVTRATNVAHKLEFNFNFEQEAYATWEDAQVLFREMKGAEGAKVPRVGDQDYEHYRKIVNAIRSSERWWYDKDGERHITDYNMLLEDADAYMHPDRERGNERRIMAKLKEQKMMRDDNPELYRRLEGEQGGGIVSMSAFAKAMQEQAQRDSYDPSAIPALDLPEAPGGEGEAPVAPSPAVEAAPTEAAKRLQAVIESGKEIKQTGKMPEDVLAQAARMVEQKVSRMDLEAFLAEQGWGNANDIVEQIQKYMEAQAEGEKEPQESSGSYRINVGPAAGTYMRDPKPKTEAKPKVKKKPVKRGRAATAKRQLNRDD